MTPTSQNLVLKISHRLGQPRDSAAGLQMTIGKVDSRSAWLQGRGGGDKLEVPQTQQQLAIPN